VRDELRQRKAKRLAIARGLVVSAVDADLVRARLQTWLDEGFRPEAIARAAGVSAPAVCRLVGGHTATVKRPVADRLMRVNRRGLYAACEGLDYVPAIGIKRRLEALQSLGWTWSDLKARGVTVRSCWLHDGGFAAAESWKAVRDVYEQLWDQPGPSRLTRNRALKAGYAPPAAWDDIDDPTATPDLGNGAEDRSGVIEDLEWMLRTGVGWQGALLRLGRADDSLDRSLRRWGRADLLASLKAADRREAS